MPEPALLGASVGLSALEGILLVLLLVAGALYARLAITARRARTLAVREQQRTAMALAGSELGTWDLDLATGAVVYNACWAAMLGYSLDEVREDHTFFLSHVHADDRPRIQAVQGRLQQGQQESFELEIRMRHRNGSWRWILDRGQVFAWNHDGSPRRMVGTHQDITERKRVEAALRESERRFELAVNGSNTGLWDWNPATDEVWYSRRCVELLGWPADEFPHVLASWVSTIHPDDLERAVAAIQAHVESREPYEIEVRCRSKEGQYRWFQCRGQAIWDDAGVAVRMAGSIYDVTEKRQTEAERNVAETSYQALIEALPDLLIRFDANGVHRDFYPPGRDGHPVSSMPADVIGRSVHEVLPPAIAKKALRAIRTTLAEQRVVSFEYTHTRPDGAVHAFEVRMAPIGEDEVLAIVRDVTERERIQVLLREERERYAMALFGGDLGTWDADLDAGTCIYDARWGRMLGYEPDEVEPTVAFFYQLLHPNDRPRIQAALEANIAGATDGIDLELRMRHQDGSWRWVLDRGKIVERNGDGSPKRIVGTHQDITERKRTEEALRESEQRFELALHGGDLGAWDVDLGTGQAYFDDRWSLMLGYDPCEVEPTLDFFMQLLHPDDAPLITAWLDAAAAGETSIIDLELRMRHRDGSWCWILDRGQIFERNDDGSPRRLVGTHQDITERKAAEEALRESEQRFELALHGGDLGLWDWNIATGAVVFNERWAEMLGYTLDEVAPDVSAWEQLVHPGDLPHVSEVLTAHMEGHLPTYVTEHRMWHKDGSWRWILDRGKVIERDAEGQPLRAVGTHLDITQRKADEEQLRQYALELQQAKEDAEQATRAKSEFLATMSHEIRTPMNGVIGMTSLLLDTDLSEEQREFVETIRVSGDALLTIINDILDFSKIEAGRVELEEHPFDVLACVEEALDLLAPHAGPKPLELIAEVDAAVPPVVIGDMTRLRQVLVNLVGNAIKFTDAGEVHVAAVAAETAPGTYRLRFDVRDTGIGIPSDRMDRLFRSFSQVDASTTRKYGGSGLGLAISKRLAELMGGTIWAESEPGQGSCFSFTIEVKSADEPAPAALPAALAGRRVCLVDDNATTRRVLADVLTSWGLAVEAVADAAAVPAYLAQADPFDVLLIDYTLPGTNGLQLVRDLREMGIAHPVVLLSSQRQRVAAEDVAAQVAKPIRRHVLRKAITDALRLDEPSPEVTTPEEDHRPAAPLSLLVAEDNLVNQKVALRQLHRLGYDAMVAANGLDVLQALRLSRYDVVLMDMQMPEMDGLEATRHIRETWPAAEQPYIIAMTANALEGDRERCLDVGMNDYLSKPVKVEALREALQRAAASCAQLQPDRVQETRAGRPQA